MQTQPLIYFERKPLSKYSEAIRRLRALLEPMPNSRLSANPTVPGEGKTTLLLSNGEFRSAGAQEELRRTPVRPFVARHIPVGKSVVPDRLSFATPARPQPPILPTASNMRLSRAQSACVLMVVQVNAGVPLDKIAAEILQSLFAARQAPAPQ